MKPQKKQPKEEIKKESITQNVIETDQPISEEIVDDSYTTTRPVPESTPLSEKAFLESIISRALEGGWNNWVIQELITRCKTL